MKSSYTLREASQETGISEDVLRDAIRANDLPVTYPTSRYVILNDALQAWLKSLPTERKG